MAAEWKPLQCASSVLLLGYWTPHPAELLSGSGKETLEGTVFHSRNEC